jgi:hypothetical protein
VRIAFPSIYDDEHAQHDRFKAALALRTLSGSQRDRLTDAWLKYQQAYRETSWKMVDAMSQPNLFGLTISGDERTVISRMESMMDDLRLERQQLNDEAALSFETILTTAQHESLEHSPRIHTNGQ